MMRNNMIGQGMGIWMLLGIIFWVLLIAGIIFLLIWVVRKASGRGTEKEESAIDILKKRYARGEISKEEYEEKRRDLL